MPVSDDGAGQVLIHRMSVCTGVGDNLCPHRPARYGPREAGRERDHEESLCDLNPCHPDIIALQADIGAPAIRSRTRLPQLKRRPSGKVQHLD